MNGTSYCLISCMSAIDRSQSGGSALMFKCAADGRGFGGE
jgi:hypothetical protein